MASEPGADPVKHEAARYLLERGADVNWVGWGDQTPLDVAVEAGHHEFADWLRDQGARPAGDLSP